MERPSTSVVPRLAPPKTHEDRASEQCLVSRHLNATQVSYSDDSTRDRGVSSPVHILPNRSSQLGAASGCIFGVAASTRATIATLTSLGSLLHAAAMTSSCWSSTASISDVWRQSAASAHSHIAARSSPDFRKSLPVKSFAKTVFGLRNRRLEVRALRGVLRAATTYVERLFSFPSICT